MNPTPRAGEAVPKFDTDRARLAAMLNLEEPVTDLRHASLLLDYFAFDLLDHGKRKPAGDNVTITMAADEVEALLYAIGDVQRRTKVIHEMWRDGWNGAASSRVRP